MFQDKFKEVKGKYDQKGFCAKLAKKPMDEALVHLYALSRRSQGLGENFPLARGSPNLIQYLHWAKCSISGLLELDGSEKSMFASMEKEF